MFLRLYIKICEIAQSFWLMQMHLKCLLLRYFHCLPFDKKLACITNCQEKQSFPWALVRLIWMVLRFNWNHNKGNLYIKSMLCTQGGPIFLGILHRQVYPTLLCVVAVFQVKAIGVLWNLLSHQSASRNGMSIFILNY